MEKHKVTLRFPVSLKESKWNRFCYFVEDISVVKQPDLLTVLNPGLISVINIR